MAVLTVFAAAGDTTTTLSGGVGTVVNGDNDLKWLLWFGVFALGLLILVYLWRRSLSANFSKMYGLVLIAILAVSLAFADIGDAAKTAAFTLLGTVAGYLAGAKPQQATTTTTAQGGGDGGGGDGGGGDGGADGADDEEEGAPPPVATAARIVTTQQGLEDTI